MTSAGEGANDFVRDAFGNRQALPWLRHIISKRREEARAPSVGTSASAPLPEGWQQAVAARAAPSGTAAPVAAPHTQILWGHKRKVDARPLNLITTGSTPIPIATARRLAASGSSAGATGKGSGIGAAGRGLTASGSSAGAAGKGPGIGTAARGLTTSGASAGATGRRKGRLLASGDKPLARAASGGGDGASSGGGGGGSTGGCAPNQTRRGRARSEP